MTSTIKRVLAAAIIAGLAIGAVGCKDMETTGTTTDPVDLGDVATPDPRQHPTPDREPIVIGPEQVESWTESYAEYHADNPDEKPRLREEAERELRESPNVDLSGIGGEQDGDEAPSRDYVDLSGL